MKESHPLRHHHKCSNISAVRAYVMNCESLLLCGPVQPCAISLSRRELSRAATERPYTVVGLWPDANLTATDLQEASFIEHVATGTPAEAALAARLQAAQRRHEEVKQEEDEQEAIARDAIVQETAESASMMAIITCFPGHLLDEHDPTRHSGDSSHA